MLASATGCVESQSVGTVKPFENSELEACLTIVVDMSGSFAGSWEQRAYPLFLELSDQFFTENAGGESRIVLCQLSGKREVVLFEGSPADLRSRFRSPKELNQFLVEHSDPSDSPVYEATDRALNYVSSMSGITDQTRVLTVILSDMADAEHDNQLRRTTGHKMLASLKSYQERGGALALYFVSPTETARWQKILHRAGFASDSYVIESQLVASPQLPRFD